MTSLIIIGHGGYGTAIKNVLNMLMGELDENVLFIDFNPEDDINSLNAKIESAVEKCKEDILFACDIAGGSPFKQCAALCIGKHGRIAVAGLNVIAYAEMANNLDMTAGELLEAALEAVKIGVVYFPE